MPFKLVIRHNIEQTADDFRAGDVRHFEDLPVAVGTADDCNCKVPATLDLDSHTFTICRGDEADTFRIEPTGKQLIFVNGTPVTTESALHSGDEIRVGHFTFRFQRERATAGQARRAGVLARLAQALIILILITEVALVYWLPRKFQSQNVLALEITKQDTVLLLDQLRRQARTLAADPEAKSLTVSAAILTGEELNRMTTFVRQHENDLAEEQWRQFRKDLVLMREVIAKLRRDIVFSDPPEPPVSQAVNALLSAQPEP